MYETTQKSRYTPTPEETKARSLVYKYLQDMIQLKNQKFSHFSGPEGERSWLQMVDSSEAILNGYTLSREAQGKEPWMSNMMDNIARVKMRAVAAGVGLKAPKMTFQSIAQNGALDPRRAEIFKTITKHSFEQGNPSLHSYLEVWHLLSHGLLVEYEGFKTGGAKRERVVSFDSQTGEVETKKEYIPSPGKPFSVITNPQEFYWWDMYKRDIQDQPRIAWVQHYTRAECQQEFGEYTNYKFLKDKAQAQRLLPIEDTTFFEHWVNRVTDEDDFEVVRIYSKADNLDDDSPCYGYEVWVNGIPMLRAPLLWGQEEPLYPFAKQIAEPYANTNFFVGMPFGQIVEAYQETKNSVLNTMVDKLYRSMQKPFLVGLQNMDVLDFEGKYVNQDNKFYVPDINQVKPFPYEGLNAGEFQMLGVFDRGIENISVDRTQQGQSGGGGRTAREVVIANQRAQELKGALYLSLEDLWYQKTTLRVQTILTHYLKDKAQQKYDKDKMVLSTDYTFADGARGILAIQINTKGKQPSRLDVEARAQAMEQQGIPYKLIAIPDDYFDTWKMDFRIVPESLREEDKAKEEQDLTSEVQFVATLFPDFLIANKDRYLSEFLRIKGKHLQDYNPPAPPQQAMPGQEGQPGMGPETPQGAPGGMPSPQEPSLLGL